MAFSTIQGSGGAPDSFVGTSGVDSVTLTNSIGNFDLRALGANDVVSLISTGTDSGVVSGATARGGDGDDAFLSLDGNDVTLSGVLINGNAGNDSLEFLDVIAGSSLLGGQGDDTIMIGEAISSLFNGNIGDDELIIEGVSSNSSFFGGKDDDTITINNTTTNSLISGDLGDDEIEVVFNLSVAGSTLNGGDGEDTIVAFFATSAVTIDGGDDDDELTGSAQADTISGGDGNDVIFGSTGTDVIDTGDGEDLVIGGAFTSEAATGSVIGQTLTFADDVDTVTGFTSDAIYDLNTNNATAVVNARTTAVAAVGDAFYISGTYNADTGVFGYSASGPDVYVGIAGAAAAANAVVADTTSGNGAIILGVSSFFGAADLLA